MLKKSLRLKYYRTESLKIFNTPLSSHEDRRPFVCPLRYFEKAERGLSKKVSRPLFVATINFRRVSSLVGPSDPNEPFLVSPDDDRHDSNKEKDLLIIDGKNRLEP